MQLRAPTETDVPAVREVVAAVEEADEDEFGYWSRVLGRRHGQRLLLGGRVTEDEEGLTGVALVREDDTLVMVHPRAEGRGVGTALRGWAEDEAFRRGHAHHRQMLVEGTRPTEALVAAGYARGGTMLRLSLNLGEAEAPEWPSGVEVAAFRPEDARATYELSERAFAEDPLFFEQSYEDWSGEFLNEESDAGLSRVVRADGAVVALCLVERWPDGVGYLKLIAVAPEWHGRGLGTAMLRDVLAGLAAAGLRQAALGCREDNTAAVRLYRGVGMDTVYRVIAYERPAG